MIWNVRSLPLLLIRILSTVFIAGAIMSKGEGVAQAGQKTYNAELEYLKVLHEKKVVEDPVLTFALMSEYLNANQHRAGIIFFQTLLDDSSNLASEKKALYLACLGVLRADHADQVPLFRRIRWVKESVALLESTRELSGNNVYGIRWLIGTVYAKLLNRFGKKEQAYEELKWLRERASEAPDPGMLREVYFQLASLYHRDGKQDEAKKYLGMSGYEDFDRPIRLVTSFAVNATTGHTFHPKKLIEVVTGRVFALSGFEFTEYYFIVSEDGRELISIDAGTRPDSARAAYEYLLERNPRLPPLTTVLFTHAHWDHIGGHRYFRELNPRVKFFIRDNYEEEFNRVKKTDPALKYFFGTHFSNEFVADFVLDTLVSKRTGVQVGGTRVEFIPIPGGETPDGLFVYLPQHSKVFVGDFIMPYLGAPFVEEGNVEGLFSAIDTLADLNPDHVLHGHETLTRRFNPPRMLTHVKVGLQWLAQETYGALRKGMGRADIHHLNLIAPAIFENPDSQLVYFIMRENVINRIVDQTVGYWGWDMTGMDYLNNGDYGALISEYLELSERKTGKVIQMMIDNGDHYLAAKRASWALVLYPDSAALQKLQKQAFLKLKEKYQFINPFKTIIYSEVTGFQVPQLPSVE